MRASARPPRTSDALGRRPRRALAWGGTSAFATTLLLAVQGCTGAIGPGSTQQTPVITEDRVDPGAALQRLPDGTPAPATGPTVSAVRIPSPASGTIPLDLTIAGASAGAMEVQVAVSRDRQATFQPATIDGAVAGRIVLDARAHVRLTWPSLRDLGFRSTAEIVLRFTVTQGAASGPSSLFLVPRLDNLRAAARRVDRYVVNYGPWTDANLAIAKRAQLVIAAPDRRAAVAALGLGIDPIDPSDDVIVLCYLSVGEDLRTAQLTTDQIRDDPRCRGDGTGPRVDPRGPRADGAPLDQIDPLGLPSNGGTGFASYYLDDNSVHDSPLGAGDGIPDRNALFGALYVNAGDPGWFDVVDGMTLDGRDGLAGLRELLTSGYGRALGCDGVFLDTMDTAAPNAFTAASSTSRTRFEWTAPGVSAFVRRVHASYPDKLIAQNRGLFFFDPGYPQYASRARGALDFVMFESYRLSSSATELWNPGFFADNRYNVAPKLMAEANRPDGFRVLSLGYAAGPPGTISPDTLLGTSTLGYDDLLEDIRVTQDLAGFRHYLAEPSLSVVNDFVATHASWDDVAPPLWTSTYNDRAAFPAVAPTPRVGIQRAVVAPGGGITVSWDVALDKNRVTYRLYAQPEPYDFTADPALSRASRFALVPTAPTEYLTGAGQGRYPYESTLTGFPRAVTQYLVIRAVDESDAENEDQNRAVLSVTPR